MDDEVKISFDYEDIRDKPDGEKLNLLIKIAFANHATLYRHSQLLFGNGNAGLCDKVRQNGKATHFLFYIFFTVGGSMIALLLYHIMGK